MAFRQFDIIQLITTKNIRYLSGPQGKPANPNGNWSVIGLVEADIVAAKDSTVIRVPISDIRHVGSYDIDGFLDKLHRAGRQSGREFDIIGEVSKKAGISEAEARQRLIAHNLPLTTEIEGEVDAVVKKLEQFEANYGQHND